jgi:hypothetical protein
MVFRNDKCFTNHNQSMPQGKHSTFQSFTIDFFPINDKKTSIRMKLISVAETGNSLHSLSINATSCPKQDSVGDWGNIIRRKVTEFAKVKGYIWNGQC